MKQMKANECLVAFGCVCLSVATACAVPFGLTTEWRDDPVGIDVARPRLAWKLPEDCKAQTAYEIEADGRACGKVASADQLGVPWPGLPLRSSQRVSWRVRVWDESDRAGDWSAPATFVTGILSPVSWRAKWIASTDPSVTPRFVRTFTVKGAVKSATLHVTGVGFYVAELNATRIGDKVLDPAPTDYDDRVFYSTYLLDEALRPGDNELALTVGHGWYDVRTRAVWDYDKAPWRGKPRCLAQLEIVYANGECEWVVTDENWMETDSGVVYDDIREGEVQTGIADPNRRRRCEVVAGPKGRLEAESQPGAKIVETFHPRAVHDLGGGRWFVDFGVDLAGWLRATFRHLPKGRTVDIAYDERSDRKVRPPRDRHIDMFVKTVFSSNVVDVASAFQTDHYIAGGRPVETFEPHFAYHGFRYVTLSGLVERPRPEDLTACAINTGFKKTGSFRCSNENLNRLMAMTDRSYRSNWTDGVPTDCPHREKNAWTGDASMASEVGQYFYENTAGYEKWLTDVLQSQRADGMIPGICPTGGWGFDFRGWGGYPGPCWDGALPLVTWVLYVYRGDRDVLVRTYDAVRRNVTFWEGERTKSSEALIPEGLGDWCVPFDGEQADVKFVTTAWHRQNLLIAAQMARVLGHCDDAERFTAWADKTKDSLNAHFLGKNGLYVDRLCRGKQCLERRRQTMQAAALAFDIVPADCRAAAEAGLVKCLADRYDHLDVGIQGLRIILRQLSQIGRTDLALKALLQPTGPSFVDWLREGSTTLREDWHSASSWNHIMFGDFAAWAYQYLAGIRLTEKLDPCGLPVPKQVGFRHFVIRPDYVSDLDFVEARVECPYGTIASAWKRTSQTVELTVVIPSGTTADVTPPDGLRRLLGPGRHVFSASERGGEK